MKLKLDNISYHYNRRGTDALKDVSVGYGAGVHLLLGPNGAGKTTMLRIIAGQLCPQAGECLYHNEVTSLHQPHTIKNIFMLTDDGNFPLNSINEMVRYHAPFYPTFSFVSLQRTLSAFGLRGDERLNKMSLGNRRKAILAYALALGTDILLLDEPANGLDMPSKKTLAQLIAEAMAQNEERCIIVATHTVQEMRNLFDTVTIVNSGTIALQATTSHIIERIAFIADPRRRDDAVYYETSLDGPCQIVPNDGTIESAIDYPLLFTAVINGQSETLKALLS